MKSGTLIAVLILTGYVALEAYTIRKASHRMEPAYIHNMLIEAKVATELCKAKALELKPRFDKTLHRVTESYQTELRANDPDLTDNELSQQLALQVAAANERVTQAVNAAGCLNTQITAHFQRYRIYAKKTR
ncbi:MAG: hypothetical protein AB8B87_08250 [Granulosicoccus sp.]